MKVAVVGCGQIADAHIQEAKKFSNVDVAAVCDLNFHMAEQAAVRFGIKEMYTDVESMLDKIRPDVVHITSSPASHLSVGETVLRHGSHAYIEKPFAVNCAEAEELIRVADQAGKLVCTGHNLTFDDVFLRLRNLHKEGVLGKIVHVDAFMGYDLAGGFGSVFMQDPTHWLHRLPGGVAHNNLSHPLSLVLEFLRDDHPEIQARGYRQRQARFGDVRDKFFDELRVFISGTEVTANILFSCHCLPTQLYVIVHGTRHQAIANFDSRTLRIVKGAASFGPFRKMEWAMRDTLEAGRELLRLVRDFSRAKLHFFQGMNELFRRFYLAVEGKAEMPIPMSEAVRTTAIMDEIFRQCIVNDREVRAIKCR
jgi:predicted dehydrogenase